MSTAPLTEPAALSADETERVRTRVRKLVEITSRVGVRPESSTSWINGLNLFNSSSSYHPNNAGHSSGYAPLVRQVTG